MLVEVLDHDTYLVKMDGSGRVAKQNRRFLCPIKMYKELLGSPTIPIVYPVAEKPVNTSSYRGFGNPHPHLLILNTKHRKSLIIIAPGT